MRTTTITLNELKLTANYEFTEGEPATHDYPGSNPSVRLWSVFDKEDNNITYTLNSLEWAEIEDQCFKNETE